MEHPQKAFAWIRNAIEHIGFYQTYHHIDFPGGSVVKNLPAMQETRVGSLGQEVLLEKEAATHSSILAWEIPWTEEPGGLQSMGSQESDMTQRLNHYHHDMERTYDFKQKILKVITPAASLIDERLHCLRKSYPAFINFIYTEILS